ncbi:MAG: FkbM family methyltransferase [Eubacterium sp.]
MKTSENFKRLSTERYGKTGFEYLDVYDIYTKEFCVRRNSMDETLLFTILKENCYDPNMWFNRNLREEFVFENVKCIVDAGANIGVASCYFANLFQNATVYSFEIEEDNFDLLCRNTRGYKNIIKNRTAIWKDNKGVYIGNRNSVIGHSGKVNPAKYEVVEDAIVNEERIDSICISDFMVQNNIDKIDILKMDIQGAEIEAFEDCERWLPKVRLLFIETHDLFRKGCSTKVFEMIAQYGKFAFIGSPNGDILAFLREDEL